MGRGAEQIINTDLQSPSFRGQDPEFQMSLKSLRKHPEAAKQRMQPRGQDAVVALSEALTLDIEHRRLLAQQEQMVAEKRKLSRQLGEAKKKGENVQDLHIQLKELASQEKTARESLSELEKRLEDLWSRVPNLPAAEAPVKNNILRRCLEEKLETGKDHTELAGWMIDSSAGTNLAGSRFVYLRGPLVRTQMALTNLVFNHLEEQGFELVIPPVMARGEALYGTGFLPDSEQQLYKLPEDDLYLVGTSEVPLASLNANQILDSENLPLRTAALSPCFRREAGAAGRDTKGLIRLHQFDKIEMFSVVSAENSDEEHRRILAIEEKILQYLELPYQVVDIAADDLGASAARKYDCEAWFPSQGKFRELTSCSNTTDFQAQRLKTRHRPQGEDARGQNKQSPQPVHMLNGTACALGRTLAALLENHQQADGTVRLPEKLVELGAPERITPQR